MSLNLMVCSTKVNFFNERPGTSCSSVHSSIVFQLDNSTGFSSTYSKDSDLSAGQQYPITEQLRPVSSPTV